MQGLELYGSACLLEPQSVLRKLCPGRLRSLSHPAFFSPLGTLSLFSTASRGVDKRRRLGRAEGSGSTRGSGLWSRGGPWGLPWGERFTFFVDRAATGLGFRGGPSCSCTLQRVPGPSPRA